MALVGELAGLNCPSATLLASCKKTQSGLVAERGKIRRSEYKNPLEQFLPNLKVPLLYLILQLN